MYDVFKMFIWDETKRERVIKEHGVDFAKIADIFNDLLLFILKITNIQATMKRAFKQLDKLLITV